MSYVFGVIRISAKEPIFINYTLILDWKATLKRIIKAVKISK